MPNESRWIWEPSPQWIERTNVWRFMRKLGFDDREAFLAYSRDHREAFWDRVAKGVGREGARSGRTCGSRRGGGRG